MRLDLQNPDHVRELLGRTFVAVTNDAESMEFTRDDGMRVLFHHQQDCCENVGIESIVGDLHDLVGSPLLRVEEATGDRPADAPVENPSYIDSETWTFYKFATIKGYVDVRWLGESNGYYSETVDVHLLKPGETAGWY